MKNLLLFAIILLPVRFVSAQVLPPPIIDATNLEQFSSRSGTVIQRELTRLGDVGGLRVDLVKASDLMEKSSMTGVRLSRNAPSGSREDNTVFLDADEIAPLLHAVDVIKGTAFSTTPESFTDLVYRTRGGFALGALYINKRWVGFLRMDRFDPRTALYVEESEVDTLKALLVKAKELAR